MANINSFAANFSLNKQFPTDYQYLGDLAINGELTTILGTAFGSNYNQDVARDLLANFSAGNFSDIPTVEILSDDLLGNANGAYAAQTNQIFLNEDFLTQHQNNPEVIVNVILEEIGHFIDAQINTEDSRGDEGDIFAQLVQGENLTDSELTVLQAEDDTGTLNLDGQVVEIEMNANTSEFITLAKPTSNTPIDGHGSNQEDIIQLQSYLTAPENTGFVQRAWGYQGADIFNVNFELPGNGKVGIDFNTGNLKSMAQMLVEPDWDVRGKRIAILENQVGFDVANDVVLV